MVRRSKDGGDGHSASHEELEILASILTGVMRVWNIIIDAICRNGSN